MQSDALGQGCLNLKFGRAHFNRTEVMTDTIAALKIQKKNNTTGLEGGVENIRKTHVR